MLARKKMNDFHRVIFFIILFFNDRGVFFGCDKFIWVNFFIIIGRPQMVGGAKSRMTIYGYAVVDIDRAASSARRKIKRL